MTRTAQCRQHRFPGRVLRADVSSQIGANHSELLARHPVAQAHDVDRALILEEESLGVARLNAFIGRVNDGPIFDTNHCVRDVASRCDANGLTHGRSRCREDDVAGSENAFVQSLQADPPSFPASTLMVSPKR